MANVLAWFYQLTHSYAGAIALLTLTVMILLLPLTLKGTKSMIQMQRLQPEIKRIQQQFKGDRQELNAELMKFYQANGINPLGGCLPMVLQFPVFIVMYRVIAKLTQLCTAKTADCKLGAGYFHPSYLSKNSLMSKHLSESKEMLSFGLDLSKSALDQLRDSFGKGLPYLLLVLIVAGTSYYQQRQVMVRSKTTGQPMNQQQMMLLRFVPLIFGVFSMWFQSALIVYFLVSNLFRIAQQSYITRAFYKSGPVVAGAGGPVITTTATDTPKVEKPPKPTPKATNKATPKAKPKPTPKGQPTPRPGPAPTSRTTPPSRPKPTGRVSPPKKKP
jgi:YidC/Oxa1 family membrane protein insertase